MAQPLAEVLAGFQGAVDAVLMEPEVPIGAGEVGAVDAQVVYERTGDRLDLAPGASPDGEPERLVAHVQEAVVLEELGEMTGRKPIELVRIRREAGVHRIGRPVQAHIHGVGVAAA